MDKRTVDYAVISNIIIDTVITTAGEINADVIGGAATYAAAGMRIWSDRVGIASGVGADFAEDFCEWFDAAGIDKRGLFSPTAQTPRGVQDYANGEVRVESSQLGMEHFALHEPYPDQIPPDYFNARGVYVFRDDRLNFWEPMLAVCSENGCTLMWELAANVAYPDHWRQIADILVGVDLFSLNYEEAKNLFPESDLDEIVERLLSTGPTAVAIRLGAKGALVADHQQQYFVPPVATNPVDYTGAGNAFCGGFLTGYCQSGDSVASAGICGAVSASFVLEQFGPPEINETLLHAARRRAADLSHSMELDSWLKLSD